MSESNKTALFFALALGAIGLALFTGPSTQDFDVQQLQGQPLIESFDVDAPKRLRITTRDQETDGQKTFEVAEINGVWSIPSKSGYPADATEQMAAAVEGIAGREILAIVSENSSDHAEFGVLDPTDTSVDSDTGFGTRVRLSDAEDKPLADVIIGNEVKDTEGHYYVRRANQDPVYQVAIDLEKFSTNFADWIEKDLLGLNTMDVSRVFINDYTVETNLAIDQGRLVKQVAQDRKSRLELRFDTDQSKWQAVSLQQYNPDTRTYEAFELADSEELNDDTLRELKNALDDLVIVDVERKPEGLSGDLQAGEEFIDPRDPGVQETVMSLDERGFIAVPDSQGRPELLSSQGEIVVTLQNGVEYVLRFGDLQIDPSREGELTTGQTEADEDRSPGGDEGLNRYLFVMARFNESAVETPELEEVPQAPAKEESSEASNDKARADESAEDASEEEAAEETDAVADDAPAPDETDEAAGEEARDQQAEAEAEAERMRVEQANERKQNEYQEKLEEGRQRVTELNARFGDWYYVIPNDVFKKIHLGREEIIKEKEAAETEDAESTAEEDAPFGAPGSGIPGLPNLNFDPGEPAEETEDAAAEGAPAEAGAPAENAAEADVDAAPNAESKTEQAAVAE